MANRDLLMDNEHLKAEVKKLERDVLGTEIERGIAAKADHLRSNSVPLRFPKARFSVEQPKRLVLNPFLRVQTKLEVKNDN